MLDAVELSEMVDQLRGLRLRIPIEAGDGGISVRAPRHLVRVHAFERRFPRGVLIRLQRQDVGTRQLQDAVHEPAPCSDARRTCTALACASSPSIAAIVIAVGPKSRRPSGVISWTVMRFKKSFNDSPL